MPPRPSAFAILATQRLNGAALASMAAIEHGRWLPPGLVISPARRQTAQPLSRSRGGLGADSAGPIANAFLRKL